LLQRQQVINFVFSSFSLFLIMTASGQRPLYRSVLIMMMPDHFDADGCTQDYDAWALAPTACFFYSFAAAASCSCMLQQQSAVATCFDEFVCCPCKSIRGRNRSSNYICLMLRGRNLFWMHPLMEQ